jgi:flagellar protein FlgJ
MDALRLETMSMNPLTKGEKARAEAEKTFAQFEAIFVRTMVQSLRQSGTCGGEGGMFGSGPGADTYADWFDQNLSEQLGRTTDIGIKKALLADYDRATAIDKGEKPAVKAAFDKEHVNKALAAADRAMLTAAKGLGKGGIDVLQ